MVRIRKDGIYKHIERYELDKYLKRGWKNVDCIEPQPSQLGLYVVNDYTISKR